AARDHRRGGRRDREPGRLARAPRVVRPGDRAPPRARAPRDPGGSGTLARDRHRCGGRGRYAAVQGLDDPGARGLGAGRARGVAPARRVIVWWRDFLPDPLLQALAAAAEPVPEVPGLSVAPGLRAAFPGYETADALSVAVEVYRAVRDDLARVLDRR